MSRLQNRVALITGGGTGMGQSIAKLFAEEGSKVVVCGRRSEPLSGTVNKIKENGGDATYITGDVAKMDNAREMVEFTVAPQVTPNDGLPLHEWYIEFSKLPASMPLFELEIDNKLQELNSYYEDLIVGKILRPLKIIPLRKDAFRDYMKSKGKLGGQNKVPRLSNDRQIADDLGTYQL